MTSEIIPYKDMEAMAAEVVRSKLFPGIQSVSQAITLFMLCQAEGLHPMRATRMFDIIQGRAAIKPKALLASLSERGGRVEWMQNDDKACIGKFYGKVCPEGVVVKFDVEDATKAGLINKPGPWQQYRADMLRHRCTGRGVDMVDPAAAFGLYSTPVVQDFDDKPKQADYEVVGDEAGAVVRGASTEAPAPPAIRTGAGTEKFGDVALPRDQTGSPHSGDKTSVPASATGQSTEEHLAEAKAKREAALADFGPKEPIEAQLEKAKAEIAKKHGRPKSIPDFCECGKPIQKFESSAGAGEYWECAHRNRERHLLKAQEADDATIRTATAGHFFKWAGK
jgi:hypothetical protein